MTSLITVVAMRAITPDPYRKRFNCQCRKTPQIGPDHQPQVALGSAPPSGVTQEVL